MRKYFIIPGLFLIISALVNAQTNDSIAWVKVNSINKDLKTATRGKRVDCYNLLAECYLWIWDDNDKHLDTSCMYANKAYEEAKKLNYKPGIAYAKAGLAFCALSEVERDRSNKNNNDKKPAYTRAYKLAEESLIMAEQIKDDYLSGLIFYHFAWFEKWWGLQDKFKANTEKAILYFDKVKREDFNNSYKPLFLFNCADCKGTEAVLAHLHHDLAAIYVTENNPLAKAELDLTVHYHNIIGKRVSLGYAYALLANRYYQAKDYKLSEKAYLESIKSYHDAGMIEEELQVRNELCKIYEIYGEFEKGISTLKTSISMIEEYFKNKPAGSATRRSAGQAYFWMSRLYKIAGDYEGALQVTRHGRQYYPATFDSVSSAHWKAEIGDIHRLLGNYDSAMYYLKDFQTTNNNPNNFGKMHLGHLYLDMKDYTKALSLILPYYLNLKNINRITPPIAQTLIIAGNASFGEKKYEKALQYAKEAQTYLKQIDGRVLMISNYKLLSDIYSKLNAPDSAYAYLKQYTRLKDSLINRQFYFKLNSLRTEAEEQKKTGLIQLLQKDNQLTQQLLIRESLLKEQKDAELALLDKENEVKDQQILLREQDLKEQDLLREKNKARLNLLDNENKLKDQRLEQQAFIRNALLGGLLLFLLLGIFIFRSLALKRKNERLSTEKGQAELQQKVAELEMQALRAQMNPHFIFNCLSSINRFIFKNDNKVASDYLTRFSRLIRMVLIHSQKKLVSLEDELEMIRIYLDLERLRFKDAFDYSITTTNIVDPGTIFIPPMLLQPFCENAVWHGLMHKETKGHLNVILSEMVHDSQKTLLCVIEDDGVGREKAAGMFSKSAGKEKSMGLKITTERLALLNREKNFTSFYKIEDILNDEKEVSGTRIHLKIKHIETTEEYA